MTCERRNRFIRDRIDVSNKGLDFACEVEKMCQGTDHLRASVLFLEVVRGKRVLMDAGIGKSGSRVKERKNKENFTEG
jgi:hypothetical protein